MEIDITDFVKNAEPFNYSASRAEMGENAGPKTWANAEAEAARKPLLTTEDELQALRDHVQAMGFGEKVQTYGAVECNALFIQLVSGDMREAEGIASDDNGEIDWNGKYRELAEEGTIGGNMFLCDIPGHACEGRIFYTLSR